MIPSVRWCAHAHVHAHSHLTRCTVARQQPAALFTRLQSTSTKKKHKENESNAGAEEDNINNIGIVGAGEIGTGVLLQALSVTSKRVLLTDTDSLALKRCEIFIDKHLDRRVQEGKLTEDQKQQLTARVSMSTDYNHLRESDFLLEAVSENEQVKVDVISRALRILRPHITIASHTSCISITRLGTITSGKERVVGMRFMHPVQAIRLVEVIAGLDTSDLAVKQAVRVAEALDKTAVCALDTPGFITSRILMPFINEAIYALNEGVGSMADIDTAARLGTGLTRGPLELADFLGLDTCLSAMRILQADLASERFQPCPLLIKYVNAGRLGRKSGQGFYKYDQP